MMKREENAIMSKLDEMTKDIGGINTNVAVINERVSEICKINNDLVGRMGKNESDIQQAKGAIKVGSVLATFIAVIAAIKAFLG